jgi:hypothetical protein
VSKWALRVKKQRIMKKQVNLFYSFVILGCFLLAATFAVFRANPYWPHILQQKELAKDLGVQINDYPASYAFPIGYFHEILKPRMTLEEVHKIIKGYIHVYNCENYKEVYYFFSENDSRAIRFEVTYDQSAAGKYVFLNLQTEDDNSRSIHVQECRSGLIRNN